ncbi:MAG: hypothetical protein EHM40_00185 [Chloroflexi bacterium]|nr:MAG: hypothetical protein EHM40_00185 [Chloroflexota bacterium]
MDKPLTPEKKNTVIEDALQTYPIATMPRDITADVLRRIQTIPAPRPFRLTWSDVALSLVISLCIGAVWFSLQHLPPLVVAQIRKESILFYQHLLVNARWLIPMLSFSLAGFLAALTIPYLRQELTKKSA